MRNRWKMQPHLINAATTERIRSAHQLERCGRHWRRGHGTAWVAGRSRKHWPERCTRFHRAPRHTRLHRSPRHTRLHRSPRHTGLHRATRRDRPRLHDARPHWSYRRVLDRAADASPYEFQLKWWRHGDGESREQRDSDPVGHAHSGSAVDGQGGHDLLPDRGPRERNDQRSALGSRSTRTASRLGATARTLRRSTTSFPSGPRGLQASPRSS